MEPLLVDGVMAWTTPSLLMAIYRGLHVFLELAAGWETGRRGKINKRIKKDRNHRQKSMLSKNEGLGVNSFFRKALNLPCRVKQHGLANSSKHTITILYSDKVRGSDFYHKFMLINKWSNPWKFLIIILNKIWNFTYFKTLSQSF